ncbi:DUF4167 domain-containing protein [Brucella ceti]|uniref:DUF4167 domain-containing protein n=1 Tax=Brucella ceti TaxID=120577 RepID=UPI0009B804D0|nr:DUF4167 domain-containing protein [Brucella ceti]
MRPAQQNRRMRGRGNNNNNNNRKGPNPLSRNYESNGPDVKIRGNAQHIAEKYSALARDAQASGDRASFHQMKCETMQIVKHRRLFDPGVFTPFNLKRDEYEASTAEQAHARTGE